MMYFFTLTSQIQIDAVELDPTVVEIAKQWFSFREDDNIKVHICDGLQYLHKVQGKQYPSCLGHRSFFASTKFKVQVGNG